MKRIALLITLLALALSLIACEPENGIYVHDIVDVELGLRGISGNVSVSENISDVAEYGTDIDVQVELPFIGIGIDGTDNLTPVSSNLTLNLPLWQTECEAPNGDTFTSIDNYEHICTVNGVNIWTSDGYVLGGTDYIEVADSDVWDLGTGDFTLDIWAQTSTLLGFQGLLSLTPAATRYTMAINAGVVGYFDVPAGGVWYGFGDEITPTVNVMAQYMLVRDTGVLSLYKNGVAATTTHANTSDIGAREHLEIGWSGFSGDFLNGVVGEVRVYDKALSAAEILRNYNATKWKYIDNNSSMCRSFKY